MDDDRILVIPGDVTCLRCPATFFSEDRRKIRICRACKDRAGKPGPRDVSTYQVHGSIRESGHEP